MEIQTEPYEEWIIRRYPNWTLYLSLKQCYLGRSYAWLNRPGSMQRLSSLKTEEIYELHGSILPAYEGAMERLWRPEHVNYAWFGNEFAYHSGHGHLHLIPRYERAVTFGGQTFTDARWGRNYAPYPKVSLVQMDTVIMIRDALRNEIR